MMTRRGVLPSDSVAMMSSTEVSAASSTLALAEAEPLGAQPHLRHRLFAGDVDRAVAGARQRRGGLDQQGRFADAGIARHQQHRAAHEAAAGDAVELGHAGRQARGLLGLAGQRLEREQAALARRAAGPAGGRRRRCRRLPRPCVFHSPQASHLPCQRPEAAPQFWQTKVRLRRDIGPGKSRYPVMRTARDHTQENISRTLTARELRPSRPGGSGGRGWSAPRRRWCRPAPPTSSTLSPSPIRVTIWSPRARRCPAGR